MQNRIPSTKSLSSDAVIQLMLSKQKTKNIFSLDDFIETRADKLSAEECKQGVDEIVKLLESKPDEVCNLIINHPFLSGSSILSDLADKLESQKQLEKLSVIYEKYLSQLVLSCVCNVFELKRCVDVMPKFAEKILKIIIDNKELTNKILQADKDPEYTLNRMGELLPAFKNAFLKFVQPAPQPYVVNESPMKESSGGRNYVKRI